MTRDEKDAVFRGVREETATFCLARGIPVEASCLYASYFGTLALERKGLRALIQAGSAGWPRVLPENDDGAMSTHFSYMWAPGELSSSTFALALGLMPEMHVWIGVPEEREIVDFTAGYFPLQARKLMGYDWPDELLPPNYFWGTAPLLDRAFYNPDMSAIRMALRLLRNIFGQDGFDKLLAAGRIGKGVMR